MITAEALEAIKAIANETIAEIVGNPWEYLDEEETADRMRIAILGAVYGIAMLVEAVGERLQGGRK